MERHIQRGGVDPGLTRRHFLRLTSLSAGAFLAGCAVNPVTGRQQLMLVSEDQEVQIDRKNSPYQFSTDYGVARDNALNDYLDRTGRSLAARTHRPRMPYSFRAVNANYVNAYAFPGGTIACTRGILLSLRNEAELAALFGHELGHVNARHTAQQMSKGMLTQAVVGGLSVIAGQSGAVYGQLASQLGMLGAGALLASYSRDNEREADSLGMGYMVGSGYSPEGMVGLMDMLRNRSKKEPGSIELMFATHPMSDERYRTAVETARTRYKSSEDLPLHRERFMDNTAKLRTLKDAVEDMQKGEEEMGRKRFAEAETHFRKALQKAPEDYTGLVLMSICQLLQEKNREGVSYAEKAQQVYPGEAKAYHLSGYGKLRIKEFEGAYQEFLAYERLLPGNPSITFFKGFAQEGMARIPDAAREYHRYLQLVREGQQAQHAYQRLKQWGYYK